MDRSVIVQSSLSFVNGFGALFVMRSPAQVKNPPMLFWYAAVK